MFRKTRAFTLLELLIVIAVLVILVTTTVVVLKPLELLRQARDSARMSDIERLNKEVGAYNADMPRSSLGSPGVVYLSVPDPTATSSAGTQCEGLSLATSSLTSGLTYHCAGSQWYQNTDGTGWIPLSLSASSPELSGEQLPVDPANSTSSGNYYTYVTSGGDWDITALAESKKYAGLLDAGTNSSITPLAVKFRPSSGLIGWWNLDEGSGTVAYDSVNGNNGIWYGTASGNSGTYYASGSNGPYPYAGYFDGSTDYVDLGNPSSLPSGYSPRTMCAWGELNSIPGGFVWMAAYGTPTTDEAMFIGANGTTLYTGGYEDDVSINNFWATGVWNFICNVYDGTTAYLYANGSLLTSTGKAWNLVQNSAYIGKQVNGSEYWPGLIAGVRIYNRALSATEIQEIYSSE